MQMKPSYNINVIEKVLNEEMSYFSRYIYQNELILNFKKGRTEAMVFGTTKRLSMRSKYISIKYNGNIMNNEKSNNIQIPW